MRELRANSKEIYLLAEGVRGRNIKNCDPPVCQHRPCRNGGTCVRYKVTPQITESVPKWPLNSKVVAFNRKPCFPFQTFSLLHCKKNSKTLLRWAMPECLVDPRKINVAHEKMIWVCVRFLACNCHLKALNSLLIVQSSRTFRCKKIVLLRNTVWVKQMP